MNCIVSIDIGGTMVKYGLINEEGRILEKGKQKTNITFQDNGIMQQVISIISSYEKINNIYGIAISTAGIVNPEKGVIVHSGVQIPNYIGTEFKKELENLFQIPCEIENDVNCAGLSEVVSGAAKNSQSTVCLTIGTGIGGCYLIGNQLIHGYNYSAGEVGYMGMHNKEFQQLASTTALIQKVAMRYNEPVENWDGEKIFSKAKNGDVICIEEIDYLVEILAEGISTICYVVNPEKIVLGGGIMEQKDYLLPLLTSSLEKKLIPFFFEKTKLTMAFHKNNAGMLGAYYNFQLRQKMMTK